MRNLNSIANTGALFHRASERFLGSCFVFRDVNTLLTAAHCVGDLQADEIVLVIQVIGNRVLEVRGIQKHPEADVAVLRVDGIDEREIGWPKHSLFDDGEYGIEVMSCGFPEDSMMDRAMPTARVFRGYVQRFMEWESHLGYRYAAAELSFRCPGGLSGGPLFNSKHVGRTYGLIAENIRTSNVLDSIEEVHENGNVFRDHYQNIIYYGIAVWLPAIEDWLDSIVPPVSNDELSRRAKLQHELEASDRENDKPPQ